MILKLFFEEILKSINLGQCKLMLLNNVYKRYIIIYLFTFQI